MGYMYEGEGIIWFLMKWLFRIVLILSIPLFILGFIKGKIPSSKWGEYIKILVFDFPDGIFVGSI
jgi:hypothetical protein